MSGNTFLPKSDFFQVEWILDYTRCGYSNSQDVLLGRQVVVSRYPINVAKIAAKQTGPD